MAGRVLAGLAMLVAAAPAGAQTLLCRRPEVLQEVGRIVRERNIYNQVDALSANEAPTARADAVICEADMTTIAYRRTASGWQPEQLRQRLRYDVQVTGNRFVVQVAP